MQYLCEYAEMIAKASAYGGGWYGQSLLAQEVAHRLILRRSALKKNDEAALEWADLLYERTVAGNEATDTVLTGSSVLNALVVAPAPNGLNEETRVDIDALAARRRSRCGSGNGHNLRRRFGRGRREGHRPWHLQFRCRGRHGRWA